jgi:hypothetical protein
MAAQPGPGIPIAIGYVRTVHGFASRTWGTRPIRETHPTRKQRSTEDVIHDNLLFYLMILVEYWIY